MQRLAALVLDDPAPAPAPAPVHRPRPGAAALLLPAADIKLGDDANVNANPTPNTKKGRRVSIDVDHVTHQQHQRYRSEEPMAVQLQMQQLGGLNLKKVGEVKGVWDPVAAPSSQQQPPVGAGTTMLRGRSHSAADLLSSLSSGMYPEQQHGGVYHHRVPQNLQQQPQQQKPWLQRRPHTASRQNSGSNTFASRPSTSSGPSSSASSRLDGGITDGDFGALHQPRPLTATATPAGRTLHKSASASMLRGAHPMIPPISS
jgi:hypothetical protein